MGNLTLFWTAFYQFLFTLSSYLNFENTEREEF